MLIFAMAVRRLQHERDCVYWITITCTMHLNLFDQTSSYSFICHQLNLLHNEGYGVTGFVIMPNHMHLLIYVPEKLELNKRIGTMKRFIAYELVKRLKLVNNIQTLELLESEVNQTDKSRGKRHDVFYSSFDARQILDEEMLLQKLNYAHQNPVAGKWNLAHTALDYHWSSCRYYELGEKVFPFLTDYRTLLYGVWQ
jgi:REP element-mobilizing transposase RayT